VPGSLFCPAATWSAYVGRQGTLDVAFPDQTGIPDGNLRRAVIDATLSLYATLPTRSLLDEVMRSVRVTSDWYHRDAVRLFARAA
jgi:hypothetical protein